MLCNFVTLGKLLVVTELCPGGNLQKFLRNNRVNYANIISALNQRQLLKMAVEVASGMCNVIQLRLTVTNINYY